MDGLGNINWWGFSPSIDLLDLYCQSLDKNEQTEPQETLNILIANAGDQRHLLNTLAFRHNHPKMANVKVGKKKTSFFVFFF